jgi:predicted O-methyltransferase YrrM
MSATAINLNPEALWTRADQHHNSFLIPADPVLEQAIANGRANGLDIDIAVSPAQGKFLNLLVRSLGAKRVLEVGTLAAYSTIWFARALPDNGEIISLELEEKHVKVSSSILGFTFP